VLPELAVSTATLARIRETLRSAGHLARCGFVLAGAQRVESDRLPWDRFEGLDVSWGGAP